MFLFLYGRLAKPWISGFGITTPKSGAPQSPPNLTPFWQRLWEISWFSRGRNLWNLFPPCTQSWGEALTYGRIYSLQPACPPEQCTPDKNSFFFLKKRSCRAIIDFNQPTTKPHNTELSLLYKLNLTFFFQAFSASWSCVKRSASDDWVSSNGLAFFSPSLDSSPVNSASLKRQIQYLQNSATHTKTI